MTINLNDSDRQLMKSLLIALKSHEGKRQWVGVHEAKKALGNPTNKKMMMWRSLGSLLYKREGGKILYDLASVESLKHTLINNSGNKAQVTYPAVDRSSKRSDIQ